MRNVLILGGRAPAALDHARRFAHQGWRVWIADSVPCRLSGWSGAVAGTLALRAPRYDLCGFAADLCTAIGRHAIDLVVPTCEEVFFLSRCRALLPQGVRVLADDFDKLRLLHSKWHFQQLARACGDYGPATMLVDSLAQARDWAGAAPVVLKPEFSRFGVDVRIYPGAIPPDAPALPQRGRWVAQRRLAGRELCSYSVAENGRLLAHAAYRPSWRIGTSASYYFEPLQAPSVRRFVEAFAAHTGFTGQLSFDWIEDAGGTPRVIECNPRATSGLHLFGLDDRLPAALAADAGAACLAPSSQQPKMIAAIMLGHGLGAALRAGETARWWRDYRRARDVIGPAGDRAPAFGAMADVGSFLRIAIRQRCTMREAATRDIEWDGEELAAG